MKRIALAFGLLAVLLLNLNAATGPQKASNDQAAIRATVTGYIESYFTSDPARMEKSLHPHYLKHTISGADGALRMTEKTSLQMIEDVRSGKPAGIPASERKEQITVLDVTGDIASAKLVTPRWVDYLTLAKWNGEWKIVSVVLRENSL